MQVSEWKGSLLLSRTGKGLPPQPVKQVQANIQEDSVTTTSRMPMGTPRKSWKKFESIYNSYVED